MLYVMCTSDESDPDTIDRVTVVSVHDGEKVAAKAGSRHAKKTGLVCVHALPVSMARPGSTRPQPGEVLAVTNEASGPVAVARVRQ